MYCAKCGSKMEDDDIFCSNCGWDSRTDAAAEPQEEPGKEGISGGENAEAAEEALQAGDTVTEEDMPQAADSFSQDVEPGKDIPQLEVIQPEPMEEEEQSVSPGESTTNQKDPPAQPEAGAALKKRKPHRKTIAIAAGSAVFLIVLVIVLINSSSIANAVKKNSSPEKYYRWVEGKALEEAAGTLGAVYEMYFLRGTQLNNIGLEAEAEISLSDSGKKLSKLLGMSGVDLSWLEDIRASVELSSKNDVIGGSIGLDSKKDTIFDITALLDAKDDMAYVQLGQLSKKYIGVYPGNLEDLAGTLEILGKFHDSLPGRGKVEKLLLKYTKLALSCVDDVEKKEDKKIRAERVSQECTELTVTLDEDTLERMALAVLEEMAEDKEIRDIILKTAGVLEEHDLMGTMDAEDAYDEFQEILGDISMNVERGRYFGSGTEIVMKVYVNGSGEVCGRSLEYGGEEMEFLMPQDGDKFGFEVNHRSGWGDDFTVTGKGTISGGNYSGEFEVASYGTTEFEFEAEDINVEKWKKGIVNGTVRFPMTYNVLRELGLSRLSSYLEGMMLTLGFSGSENSVDLTCGIGKNDEMWGSIAVGLKVRSGERMSVPSGKNVVEIEKMDDIWDYVDTLDLDAYVKKLAKTSIPEELVEFVEELADMDVDDIYGIIRDIIWYGF